MENVSTEAVVNAASEVQKIAQAIYDQWKSGGAESLERFFSREIGVPDELAKTFAKAYNPDKPPVNGFQEDALKNKWTSSEIFGEMSIQFRNPAIWPKNVLAWWIMRHVFGNEVFDFKIPEDSVHEHGRNKIYFPALPSDEKGNSIRFGLAALEVAGLQGFPAHVVRKATYFKEKLGDLGFEFAKSLIAADCIFPPAKEVEQLAQVIKRGLAGEKVIITGAFCPDYAYEETASAHTPYRYTFESVSSGVGLVAKQFVRVLPHIVEFFEKNHIEHEVILFIGDFEANSDLMLQRVGKTKEKFIDLCKGSLEAFQQSLPQIEMQLFLFEQQWANGRWLKYCQQTYNGFLDGNYGQIRKHTGKYPQKEVVNFIAAANKEFYERWYGKKMTEDEIVDIVLLQGSEYAAMGKIMAEDWSDRPFIQIAGDRPKMQAFNNVHSGHPTICAKRVY